MAQLEDPEAKVRQGISVVFRAYLPGSGAGRPRVPESLPNSISDLTTAVLDICALERVVDPPTHFSKHLSEEGVICYRLLREVTAVCEQVREAAGSLVESLPAEPPRFETDWRSVIEERLASGSLPFPNSEICPVDGAYGMQVRRWDLPEQIVAFAEQQIDNYRLLDDLSYPANEWSRRIAIGARQVLDGY